MKYRNSILWILIIATLLGGMVFTGCKKMPLKGELNSNVPPRIYWADVPVKQTFSQSPNLRWYSTDIDGLVLDYQFAVLLTTTVDSLGGADNIAANPPSDLDWSIVHKDSASIPLYAAPNPDDSLSQFVFLRAMDDDSAFSSIIYKSFFRKNHAPTNYLVLPTESQWCLPETTATWKGIKISWVGKDSIDIPGLQPDFQWNVRVYGPFLHSNEADTLPDHLYGRLVDPEDGSDWVLTKQYMFTNLVTGWYMVYARCRDDAYVPAIPATGLVEVYEPTWIRPENAGQTKPILIANHSVYLGRSPGNLADSCRTLVNQFYRDLMDSVGITPDQYDWAEYATTSDLPIPKSDLYNHRLVIALDTDMARPLAIGGQPGVPDQEGAYADYLNVGGMLWVLGRRSFENPSKGGRIEFGLTSDHKIAYTHFNMSAVFAAAPTNFNQAEFVSASPLVVDYPDLPLDSMKVRLTSALSFHYAQALRGVDFIIRMNDPGPQYKTESLYKFDAINPDTSRFHNFPVAIRYSKGTFKTSYFTFPLFFVQTPAAVDVTRKMLDWFFQGIN